MGSKRTSRRDLLRSGAALAGGLTLGVPVHAQVHDHSMAPASGSENAYPMIPGNREMIAYGERAEERGLRVIIAGAGGAAHLPGMLASVTPLPVIGVPVPLKYLDGMDSLLSIGQMPAGIPVATVAVGGARNAGLLAVRILAAADPSLRAKMAEFQASLTAQARAKGAALRSMR